jgi:integrase
VGRSVRDAKLDTREARLRLKVREDREPYWRLISEGLHVGYRRNENGGVWVVRYRNGARYFENKLGAADDLQDPDGHAVLTFKQAQVRAQKVASAGSKTVRGGPLTVADATEHYLSWFRVHRKSSKDVEQKIRATVLPTLGARLVSDLTNTELKRWRDKLASQGRRLRAAFGQKAIHHAAAPTTDEGRRARKATVNRTLSVLKAILNKAFEDDLVDDDREWRKVKPFANVDSVEIRFLTEAEAVRLVNACAPALRSLARAALFTGARYGELARMKVSHFDARGGRVYVTAAAKSGNPRFVPLSADGVKFFSRLAAGKLSDDLLFTQASGAPWGKNNHAREFVETNARAKIQPRCSFHDLRHTYASHFANQPGNTLDLLAEILGHSDTRITKRNYAHLFDHTLKTAVARMPSFGYVDETDNVVTLRQ